MNPENVLMGNRIAAARAKRGWTKADLARRAGVVRSYISRIEAGEFNRPSVDKVKAIADALGIGVRDLVEPPPATANTGLRGELEQIFRRADDAEILAEIAVDLAQDDPDHRAQILVALRTLVRRHRSPDPRQ